MDEKILRKRKSGGLTKTGTNLTPYVRFVFWTRIHFRRQFL